MPKNGKLIAILSTVIGALLVAAVLGVFHTRDLSKANAQTISTNAVVCKEHRKDTKEMPKQVAVVESTVSDIKTKQDKMDGKLDAILERLPHK